MAQETKVVKGGFRATLALIISIIALVLSFFAYSSTGKQETSKKMDTLRGETADTLDKLSKSLKKEEGQE